MKNDLRSLAWTQLHLNSVLDIIGFLSAFWLLAAQCWTFGIMCGKGYYDTQRWGNSYHFCSVGKFAWLLERLKQEASRCAEMLITKGQACTHHDIIKHNRGLIYLRTVMSLVLSGEKQRTGKVRVSSRFSQREIYAEEENTDRFFANDIRNVLVTRGPEVWSGTLLSFCRVISKMKTALIASLAWEERPWQSSGQIFRPP